MYASFRIFRASSEISRSSMAVEAAGAAAGLGEGDAGGQHAGGPTH